MHKLLGSSVDANKLAMTVKGILIGIAPVIIALAAGFDIEIGEAGWNNFVEAIYNVVVAGGVLVGAVTTAWGLVRKGIIAWKNRKVSQ